MPFAPRSKLEQEQQGQQGGINISGGQSANFATGVPGQEKSAKSSGQYANLQSYLDANQNQAGEMGNKLASNVESQGADATNKINTFESQKQSVAAYDPNTAINNAPNLNQQQKSEYQTMKATGGYTGPSSVDKATGFQEAQAAAAKAGTAAKQAGTEVGQQELLKQNFARPDYSQGQVKLDQALMRGSDSAKTQLQGVSSKYADLENLFNTKSNEVGTSINAANAQALANKQAFNPAETNAWKGLLDPIQARADQLNTQNPLAYQNVMGDISDDTLSAETLQMLGLSDGQALWDTNLSSYLTPNQTQLGINDAANADERGRYSALADLFQDPTRSQIGDKGLDTKALSFDKTKFDKDVESKGAEYKKAYENNVGAVGLGAAAGQMAGSSGDPSKMTPKQLETIYFPMLEADAARLGSPSWYMDIINGEKQLLQNWKDQYKNTRTIKAGK